MPQPDASAAIVYGTDPRSGHRIDPGFPAASLEDVARLCDAADAAFDPYRETRLGVRAAFLEKVADEIIALGDALIETAILETGLSRPRLEGERARTVSQLRLFADVVRKGDWIGVRIDSPLPDRTPVPRPALRLRRIPLGPVAVFGASNFPLAFSVAGGDTASALAAGCPVVVKAHPAHPGTSQLVSEAIEKAVQVSEMPAGTFGLIQSADHLMSSALVGDPRIKAVGFTGSQAGGRALMAVAAGRQEPIPVYAEMSSTNPVVVLPCAMAARADRIAAEYTASLTLGVGQFCTNPGLMVVMSGEDTDAFLDTLGRRVGEAGAGTMLSPQIHWAYAAGVAELELAHGVRVLARGLPSPGPFDATPTVFGTTASQFAADPKLAEEVFGPTGMIVRCESFAEMKEVLSDMPGQLTVSLHMEAGDYPMAAELLPLLEKKAGRILANGFGTGVEVAHAMVHGGPFPATSDGRSTSVGSLAIDRFLRPVCYQDMPAELLPLALQDNSPEGLARLVDGVWQRN